jgi:hypothetical protein
LFVVTSQVTKKRIRRGIVILFYDLFSLQTRVYNLFVYTLQVMKKRIRRSDLSCSAWTTGGTDKKSLALAVEQEVAFT